MTGRAGQEGDDLGDVGRRTQPAEWDGRREPGHRLFVLAVEEHFGGRRTGRNGVHVDAAVPELGRQDQGHGLDRAFGGGVGRVPGQEPADHRRGEVEDRSARRQPAGGLLAHDEGAADVGPEEVVEYVEVQIHQGGQ